MKIFKVWVVALAVILGMTFLSQGSILAQQPQPQRGGTLRVGMIGEPPSLDHHWTTSITSAEILNNINEGLFAIDSKFTPRPMLVDKWTVSPNRLTYTFTLRRGVRFHNGKELTSEDVKASLERWGRVAGRGRALFATVTAVTAPDPLTVVLRLREPHALLLAELGFSQQLAAIFPKEVVEEAGTEPIRRFIGTGPYRFVEHLPDRHIRLDRFEGYIPRGEEPDGETGRKHAYLDSLFFIPLPDASVRIAGVQRGEYHFARWVPPDEFARLRAIPGVVPHVVGTPWQLVVVFNHRAGLMTNPKIRQAFQAALDYEAVLRGTFGPREFWRMNPGLVPIGHPMWTDAGKEFYNQKNPAKARQLLTEAGYAGQPLRWVTTMELPAYGISAQLAKPMQERAGLVVDLQFMDWASAVARRGRPELWDAFSTAMPPQVDPALSPFLVPGGIGWYDYIEKNAMLTLMRRHSDHKVRMDIMRRLQTLWFEHAGFISYGDYFGLNLHRRELHGYMSRPSEIWWNSWLERR